MTHVSRFLTLFILMTIVTGCGVGSHKQQPIKKQPQAKKEHTINVTFNFDTGKDIEKRVSGFRLYKEGELICETTDPRSTKIDCAFSSDGGAFQFTMTTYFEDGSESGHSEPFTYTIP